MAQSLRAFRCRPSSGRPRWRGCLRPAETRARERGDGRAADGPPHTKPAHPQLSQAVGRERDKDDDDDDLDERDDDGDRIFDDPLHGAGSAIGRRRDPGAVGDCAGACPRALLSLSGSEHLMTPELAAQGGHQAAGVGFVRPSEEPRRQRLGKRRHRHAELDCGLHAPPHFAVVRHPATEFVERGAVLSERRGRKLEAATSGPPIHASVRSTRLSRSSANCAPWPQALSLGGIAVVADHPSHPPGWLACVPRWHRRQTSRRSTALR
jgi:hypothetical protein